MSEQFDETRIKYRKDVNDMRQAYYTCIDGWQIGVSCMGPARTAKKVAAEILHSRFEKHQDVVAMGKTEAQMLRELYPEHYDAAGRPVHDLYSDNW